MVRFRWVSSLSDQGYPWVAAWQFSGLKQEEMDKCVVGHRRALMSQVPGPAGLAQAHRGAPGRPGRHRREIVASLSSRIVADVSSNKD